MTLDELKALAEKAKAWRFKASASCGSIEVCEGDSDYCGHGDCGACLGAQRAVDDIAERITNAVSRARLYQRSNAIHAAYDYALCTSASKAARIASYFCSEPNPVSEFRDAVKEFCR